jgi:hypothetical protein
VNETMTPIEAGLYLNLHVRTISRLEDRKLKEGGDVVEKEKEWSREAGVIHTV